MEQALALAHVTVGPWTHGPKGSRVQAAGAFEPRAHVPIVPSALGPLGPWVLGLHGEHRVNLRVAGGRAAQAEAVLIPVDAVHAAAARKARFLVRHQHNL